MTPTKPWEEIKLDLLRAPEAAAEYIIAFIEDGDPLNECLADVIKAQGLARMARLTGIAAPNLLRVTRKGHNPTVATLQAILGALDMELSVRHKKRKPTKEGKRRKLAKAA
jgi:probable addiction module antidote protein